MNGTSKVRPSDIAHVSARQIYSDRGHPGVEATVVTRGGAVGVAVAAPGISVGEYEAAVVCDEGDKWDGLGMTRAVRNVVETIGPSLIGLDATDQRRIDEVIVALDGTRSKEHLGANATGSVSAAVLRAGAAAAGLPLYQHIRTQRRATGNFVLPVPSVTTVMGGRRYGGTPLGGTKPTYSMVCFDFSSYSEAIFAGWESSREYFRLLWERYRVESWQGCGMLKPGTIEHDRQLWDLMVEAIENKGYTGRIGLQVDVAASMYFESSRQRFVGLFSAEDKTREDLVQLYGEMVSDYPFVVIEDPLDEGDYDGHARLTRDLGIQIVGDDLFATNEQRLREGIAHHAANGMVLKVNQVGTISEAFETVALAQSHGYRVIPCKSRGEGAEIADYAVGLDTGQIREEDTVGGVTNRLTEIERELGAQATFLGRQALAVAPRPRMPRLRSPEPSQLSPSPSLD
ncbi:MAG: enolase C-terminal domain-like protein [Myxococcota bacterium]